MVPKGWVEHTLGDVTARIHQGINTAADKIQYAETGLPILQTKHISSGSIHFDDAKYINKVDYEKYREKYNPRINNILFSNIGTIGKSCIIKENKDFLIAWNILLIEPLRSVSPEYLHAWLLHYEQIGHFDSLIAGNAAKFINKGSMESLAIPTPPFAEQSKIAQILSTWDKAIATTERLLANSQQQKQALLGPLLSGKKRFRGYPKWVNTPIAKLLTESRLPGSNGEVAKKITVKLYGNGVFAKDEKRIGSESTKYFTRKAGQFIYSKLDFLNGAFGIIPEHLDGYESTLDLPAFNFTEYVEPAWLVQYISREEFYSAQLGLANGGRKARRVNPADLLNIEIPLPSLPEQQKIAQVLSTADAEISNLQAQLATLKLEKKSLMQQLLTGQRRVKLDAEVAA